MKDGIVTDENVKDTLASNQHSDDRLILIVPRDIRVTDYFDFIDSVASAYDSLVAYDLNEHLLVLSNSWIIDTLAGFDYYKKMEQGIFIYDQKKEIVLHKGDTLFIPSVELANDIKNKLKETLIDVNIPEFRLRIIENDTEIFSCAVRVGRNESRYLKMARRKISLRTPIGEGMIVRAEKDPWFINPVNNHRYFSTVRDDGRLTRLPRIPFLEPMIAGRRQGALIHPTTNEKTLGKAYSNGCVGTPEGDAWIIYYHAPIGTRVKFRYDLKRAEISGDTTTFEDIYQLGNSFVR